MKPTPEDRDRRRQLREQNAAARENMQAIIDRVDARMRERRERARRGFFRRMVT